MVVRRPLSDDGSKSSAQIVIQVAGENINCVNAIKAKIITIFPEYEEAVTDKAKIKMDFWSYNKREPEYPSTSRKDLYAKTNEEIKLNYTKKSYSIHIRVVQTRVYSFERKLLLWHGIPGTGKTYLIRALCQAWKEWCDFCYIVDSEKFFEDASSYMNAAVLRSQRPNHWNLLIIEDASKLISANANSQSGKGLSRLLNMTEGMIGQGLNLMVMITTNENIGKLHSAVSRPGRCLDSTEFDRLSVKEANKVLAKIGSKKTVT